MLTMTDMHLGGPHPEPGESRSFPGTEITQVGMRTIVAACLTLNITSSPATTDRPEREGTTSCGLAWASSVSSSGSRLRSGQRGRRTQGAQRHRILHPEPRLLSARADHGLRGAGPKRPRSRVGQARNRSSDIARQSRRPSRAAPNVLSARLTDVRQHHTSGLECPQPLILASVGTAPDRREAGAIGAFGTVSHPRRTFRGPGPRR